MGRLMFLMLYRSEHYSQMAEDLHERERTIKAARGNIVDATGTVLSLIHIYFERGTETKD